MKAPMKGCMGFSQTVLLTFRLSTLIFLWTLSHQTPNCQPIMATKPFCLKRDDNGDPNARAFKESGFYESGVYFNPQGQT